MEMLRNSRWFVAAALALIAMCAYTLLKVRETERASQLRVRPIIAAVNGPSMR